MGRLLDEDIVIDALIGISGSKSIEELTEECEVYQSDNRCYSGGVYGAIRAIKSLPTIQPETKEGHWIPHESPDGGEQYECSRCGVLWEFNDGTPEDNEAYFCPKCGTKLITK